MPDPEQLFLQRAKESRFLAGGEANLKSRESDPEDEEKRRLKSAIANVTVENELLREKIAQMENGRPLALRKLKR